jgi:hypothetical protein
LRRGAAYEQYWTPSSAHDRIGGATQDSTCGAESGMRGDYDQVSVDFVSYEVDRLHDVPYARVSSRLDAGVT